MSTLLIRNLAIGEPWTCEAAKQVVRNVRDTQEHVELLRAKTLEEFSEFVCASNTDDMLYEAGDVLETLISSIYVQTRNHDYTREQIEEWILEYVHQKRERIGDFTDGLVLEIKRAKE